MGKILLCIIVLTLISCDFAQNLLYPLKDANQIAVPDLPPQGYLQDRLEVNHPNGKMQVHFWYFEQLDATAPVLLFFHGQGENIGNPRILNLLKNFENSGSHFVLVDYPGYGKSTGVPSQSTILAGSDVVMSWIQNHFKDSKIYVFGYSLGSAVAAQVAKVHQQNLAGFILASGWSSLEDLIATYGAPSPPGKWFQQNKWDSVAAAHKTNLPGLLIHGDKDSTIPFALGSKLAEAYSQIEFVPIAGADHANTIKSTELWNSIKNFIGN